MVLARGSIESPKLLRRSSIYPSLPDDAKGLLGRGLTDHPTSSEITGFVTKIGSVDIPKTAHAKIIFYSRGRRVDGQTVYPFNVEMNINHEWWHLRENDPTAEPTPDLSGASSRVDIKFSFANPLDEANEIRTPPFHYVREILFRNQSWMDHLAGSRFPAIAGWQKSFQGIWDVMNGVAAKAFAPFSNRGAPAQPQGRFGEDGRGFGWGTV